MQNLSPYANVSNSTIDLCPQTFNCTEKGYVSFDIGRAPSYVAIASSSLSCLGSFLVIATFLLLKDMRTGAQKIITFLAVADLISAAGYIFGSINFLVHFDQTNSQSCQFFHDLCRAQASITSWSSLCSFCWTLILAFYFYMVIVYNRKALASRLLPLYHIIAWIGPLFLIVPLTVLDKLGYARYAASNWCFVAEPNFTNPESSPETIAFIFVAGKQWEILTYIGVILIYALITIHLWRHHHRYQFPPGSAAEQAEKRLLYIPALFLLLRIWGTAQLFYSIGVTSLVEKPACIPHGIQSGFVVFGILQAIGDPGQGWGNAILYVFMSPVVRKQLITNPLRKLIRKTGRAMMAVGGDSSNDEGEEGPDLEQNRQGELQNEARVVGTSENTIVTSDILYECEPTPCASPGPPPPGFHQPPNHPTIQEVSESTTETTTSARLPV